MATFMDSLPRSTDITANVSLSANRSAKSTAIKAQQASLLGLDLCLLTVAAIVSVDALHLER